LPALLARAGFRWLPRRIGRCGLEQLNREELIKLALWLQQPEKTSRTSFKSLAADRKEQRAKFKLWWCQAGCS
jgi:hypothetical protein